MLPFVFYVRNFGELNFKKPKMENIENQIKNWDIWDDFLLS
jgi:hypothetical protein